MRRPRELVILTSFALIVSANASLAQPVAGGQSGYDASLDAIEPTNEPVNVGLGGDDPADIGRYLLAANGGARNAQLSPNGEFIAFSWSITGEPQIWLSSVSGGSPKRLTYGNGISFFRWAPNSEQIIYGADNNGNEQEAYLLIDIATGRESILLEPAAGGFRRFGDFIPSIDSIAYASTERNRLDFDIYLASLQTKQPRIVYEGEFAYIAHSASPDGNFLVVSERVGEDSDNLYLLGLDSGDLQTLSAPTRRASHSRGRIAWKGDSSGFYLASNVDREFASLTFYDLERGFAEVQATNQDVGNITLCGDDDRYLIWTENVDGFSQLNIKDLIDDRTVSSPQIPEGVYRIDCQGMQPRIVVTINGWRTPGDIVSWQLPNGSVQEIFNASLAGLDPDRLVRPESIRMTARDGVELQGLLYLPDNTSRLSDNPPPIVFQVHGGPTGQSRPTFDATAQYHVDRGIAVFEPNVRGSLGFGHTYVTLDDRENRIESVQDLVDMLRYFNEDGRVDATKAAVVGGSYGGYMVNAVLANFPGFFVAGASLFGVADWVTALQIASPALKASDRIEYGDISEPRWLEYYQENSPIRQANNIDVPVLYSHGVMDPRIDISETETMVKTLRGNGIDAPFVRMPDEGHGWRKLSNQLFYYRRQAEFLEEQLLSSER